MSKYVAVRKVCKSLWNSVKRMQGYANVCKSMQNYKLKK